MASAAGGLAGPVKSSSSDLRGLVNPGMIRDLPSGQSRQVPGARLLISTPREMIDNLAAYAEFGIDRVILSANFGLEAQETLDMIHCFAEDVMPVCRGRPAQVAAQ